MDPNSDGDDTGTNSPFGRQLIAASVVAGLFAVAYGADGAAAANNLAYALTDAGGGSLNGAATGLFATGEAAEIILVVNGSVLEGRVGGAAGTKVFTIAIDPASGELTVEQFAAIDHGDDGNNHDSTRSLIDLVHVTASATDGDSDTVSATAAISISFEDDGLTPLDPELLVTENTAGAVKTAALDIDGNIGDNAGTDGLQSIRFPTSLAGANTGLTSGGLPITYSISGLTLTASTAAGTVFQITLNPDGDPAIANDTYTLTMIGTVDGGASTVDFDASGGYNFQGGNNDWAGFSTLANDNSGDLLLTPMVNGLPASTVNSTANTGGINNSFVGPNEAMRVDFVTDLTGNNAGLGDYDVIANRDHAFEGHYNTNGAVASFTGISGGGPNPTSTILIKAFDDFGDGTGFGNDGTTVVGDGIQESITAVAIKFGAGQALVNFATIGTTVTTVNVGGVNFTVQFVDVDPSPAATLYEVRIGGVVSNTQIGTYTADGYSSIQYHHADRQEFQIGDFGTTVIDPGTPVSFEIPVEIVDGDGDVADGVLPITLMPEGLPAPQDFSSSLTGVSASSTVAAPHIIGSDFDDVLSGNSLSNILLGGDGDDAIVGNSGEDWLFGNDGSDGLDGGLNDDVLNGGAGSDELIGGSGADTFVIGADSMSLAIDDLIVDFESGAAGDTIDLSELLSGIAAGTDLEASGHVSVVQNGADAQLLVDQDGGGNDYQTVAVLENFAFNSASEAIKILYDTGSGTTSDVV
ncbi:DUF5801 repeats-in-toxin domain-containing protein (plasmid) [Mesorhizobium sp. AaZ16]|uniref:DUF5801 repeats-in-toxin domain-containing protein n=1 Tax=Mesorhizobium sp. AaZ16 TaxID=3402289 RepID=UPI00374F203D